MLTSQIRSFAHFEPLESRRLFASSISGLVFDDKNGNGVRETVENGLGAQIVYIDANLNGVLDKGETSVLTNASGVFTFDGVADGTHRIRHVPPVGRRLTSPHSIFFDVVVPQRTVEQHAFGNSTMGVIRGMIFEDLNADGQKQSNESPLPGWRLFLDKDGDGIYDPGKEKTRLTNSRGEYRFADLPAGLYFLRVEQKGNYLRTNPLNGLFKVTIASGSTFSNRNFAEKEIVTHDG